MLTAKENKLCYASPEQREILVTLAVHNILPKDFFLTGGTALSVFFLHHRQSNDLDFFTTNRIDLSEIDFQIKTIWKRNYVKIKYSPDFLSLLLRNVKVDFVIDELSTVGRRMQYVLEPQAIIYLDFLDNILSNKFCTLASRTEPKDFIDFYYLYHALSDSSFTQIYSSALKKDAIFEDPPTVAFQIEQGVSFFENNPQTRPELKVEFNITELLLFYENLTEWIYKEAIP